MKTAENVTRICPLCGAEYHGVPALSRNDNETKICPDCGTKEALESAAVTELSQMHSATATQ